MPGDFRLRFTISADTSEAAPLALHQFLAKAVNQADLPLDLLHVAHAKLRFTFEPSNGDRRKTLTFDVKYPDHSTLRDDPHDQIAKKYLKEWGIARD